MSIAVIVQFKVKNDAVDEFQKIIDQVVVDLQKVTGCRGVTAYQGQGDRTQFLLNESWDSQALHQQHIQNLVTTGGLEQILSLLTQPPLTEYYTAM